MFDDSEAISHAISLELARLVGRIVIAHHNVMSDATGWPISRCNAPSLLAPC